MYQHGQGQVYNKPEYPAAIMQYRTSIALGFIPAIHNLASMCRHGQGQRNGKPAYYQATCYLMKAIDLGDLGAIFTLSAMYQSDKNMLGRRDYGQAAKHIRQAFIHDNATESIKTFCKTWFFDIAHNCKDISFKYHYMAFNENLSTFFEKHSTIKTVELLCNDALLTEQEKQVVIPIILSKLPKSDLIKVIKELSKETTIEAGKLCDQLAKPFMVSGLTLFASKELLDTEQRNMLDQKTLVR